MGMKSVHDAEFAMNGKLIVETEISDLHEPVAPKFSIPLHHKPSRLGL